jgi:beta-lactamase regulating signal transducer with metallopeptidase domain
MTIAVWAQFGALVVALVTLIVQQTRELRIRRRSERRTENKFKVYYMCQTDTELAEDEICTQYARNHPAG